MKKLIYIVLTCMALGIAPAMASPDGVNASQRTEAIATATGTTGHIQFYAGSSEALFQIYSITGQLIKTVKLSADGHTTIDMPKGFYVVKCNGQWSRKVIVK